MKLPKLILICRLCGDATNSYKNIFSPEDTQHTLNNKILTYLKIEVSSSDLLPKILCNKCFHKIEEFHNFFLTSKKMQLKLRNTINGSLFSVKINIKSLKDEASNEKSLIIDQENDHIPLSYDRDKQMSKKSEVQSIFYSDKDQEVNENIKIQEDNNQNENEMILIDELKNDYFDHQEISDFIYTNENSANKYAEETNNSVLENLNDSNCFQTITTENPFHSNSINTNLLLHDELDDSKRIDSLVELIEIKENNHDLKSCFETNINLMNESICLPCTSCTKIFMNLEELINHYKQQHCDEVPTFKCTVCGEMYNVLKEFYLHYHSHYKVKKHICLICGRSFNQHWSLRLHAAAHSNVKPYKCDECDKFFKTPNSLRAHKKSHLLDAGKLIYTCSYCNKSFKSKFILTNHEKKHTGQKDFICDICGKLFVNKRSLLFHISIHNYNTSTKCRICNKLVHNTNLNQHLVLHSTEEQLKCEFCGKQYRCSNRLNDHRRLHTRELPYECEYCLKRFRLNNTLIIHRRQHTGEKPYECRTCDRQFTNWPNYNKHMNRKHNAINIIENNDELTMLKI